MNLFFLLFLNLNRVVFSEDKRLNFYINAPLIVEADQRFWFGAIKNLSLIFLEIFGLAFVVLKYEFLFTLNYSRL